MCPRGWALLLGAALAASCTGSRPAATSPTGPPAATATATASGSATAARTAPPAAQHPSKVLLIMEENHSSTSALDGMPTLAAEARVHGYATHYRAAAHPSLPNYLALAGGSTFGVHDDAGPDAHPLSGPSVFDQAVAAGRSAKIYAESMTTPCQRTSDADYAVKHNPWPYFTDATSRANCSRFDLPAGTTTAGALLDDARGGTLPTVGMLVPNRCNDAHDCPLATADAWLARWLAVLKKGPDWMAGRLAIVVTFDENEGGLPNDVLTVVSSPRTRQVVTAASLTHYSWTRYAAELSGAPPLRQAASAPSLSMAFGL